MCASHNVRSFTKHHADVAAMPSLGLVGVLFVCETRLGPHDDTPALPAFQHVCRNDCLQHSTRCHGSLIYSRHPLLASMCFNDGDIECTAVTVAPPMLPYAVTVLGVYKSPRAGWQRLVEQLQLFIDALPSCASRDRIVCCGDFNTNVMREDCSGAFKVAMQDKLQMQLQHAPFATTDNGTCLDHVRLRAAAGDLHTSCGTCECVFSDHKLVWSMITADGTGHERLRAATAFEPSFSSDVMDGDLEDLKHVLAVPQAMMAQRRAQAERADAEGATAIEVDESLQLQQAAIYGSLVVYADDEPEFRAGTGHVLQPVDLRSLAVSGWVTHGLIDAYMHLLMAHGRSHDPGEYMQIAFPARWYSDLALQGQYDYNAKVRAVGSYGTLLQRGYWEPFCHSILNMTDWFIALKINDKVWVFVHASPVPHGHVRYYSSGAAPADSQQRAASTVAHFISRYAHDDTHCASRWGEF